jgi:hypothetical protein
MLEALFVGPIAVGSAWLLGQLVVCYVKFTDAKDWREVQEQARTKGILVGSLRALRK